MAFDEKQAVIDMIVTRRYAEAVLRTAAEYNTTVEHIESLLRSGDEQDECEPAYMRYYEILQEYVDEAERA